MISCCLVCSRLHLLGPEVKKMDGIFNTKSKTSLQSKINSVNHVVNLPASDVLSQPAKISLPSSVLRGGSAIEQVGLPTYFHTLLFPNLYQRWYNRIVGITSHSEGRQQKNYIENVLFIT